MLLYLGGVDHNIKCLSYADNSYELMGDETREIFLGKVINKILLEPRILIQVARKPLETRGTS